MFKVLAILFPLTFLTAPYASAVDVILNGAGATFPHPLYKEWIKRYREETGVRISYEAIGSGGGIRRLLSRQVDFGATDAFLSEEELKKATTAVLHTPTCLGAVVITYHLPENPVLRFTPEVISEIFLGRITKWTDPEICSLNPDFSPPDRDITVIHRSEGSGTTFIFTDYLSKVSTKWRVAIGRGKKVRWVKGLGVEGNPGITQMVKKVPGSIGYVELAYAKNHDLPVAFIKNLAGRYKEPTLVSVSSAAEVDLPPDTRVMITNTSAPDGYPISAFTWLIYYKEQYYHNRSVEKAKALARFLWWATYAGQQYNEDLYYAPLPDAAVASSETLIRSMTYKGEPVVDW